MSLGLAALRACTEFYLAFVRGQAYLLAHRYGEAEDQFRKILDYPGVVFTDPVEAMARLQPARAFLMSGDNRRVKGAYQDFLTLWNDADANIPDLRQARAEFAKL